MFPRQLGAHVLAGGVHESAVHDAIRPGEVDPLEHAQCAAPAGGTAVNCALHAVAADDCHLSGVELAHEFRLHVVQGAGLGSDHPSVVQATQAQGPDAQRIAHRDDGIRRQQRQGECPLHARHGVENPLGPGIPGGVGQKLSNYFAVGAGLEHAIPLGLCLLPQLLRVDDVAIVRHRQGSVQTVDQEGLSVVAATGSGGRVPGVTDGQASRDPVDVAIPESLGHQAHTRVQLDPALVGRCDAGGLLPPVLQREKADGGQRGAV